MKKLAALLTGLLILFSAATATWAQDAVHVVKKGDTLWDITHHYLSNPWKWPIVWSNNQDITNPHLIYPGDRVIISTKAGKTTITIIPANGGEPGVYTTDSAAGVTGKSFMISPQYSSYIYSPNTLAGSGSVAKKVEQGELITRNEGIIIKSKSALAPGKYVTIVTKITEAKDKDVVKGYLYRAVGVAKIEHHEGDLYKAVVLDSIQEIHLGDIIYDDIKGLAPMKITLYEPTLKAPGRIMDLYGGTVQGSSTLDIIFLSVGKSDGVDKGAIVTISKDVPVEGETATLRDYRGNALVLQALDNSSLALVADSLVPLQRDFVVEGKK